MQTLTRSAGGIALIFGMAACSADSDSSGASDGTSGSGGTAVESGGGGSSVGGGTGASSGAGSGGAFGGNAGTGATSGMGASTGTDASTGTGGVGGAGGAGGVVIDGGGTSDAAGASGIDAGAGQDPCGAFPAALDLASPGPFAPMAVPEGPNCTMIRPSTLGEGGLRHPVILWANGTGGFVLVYQPAFELWASHGFIVAADNASNGQGSGAGMIACLEYLLAQNTTANSPYEGRVCARTGASGHSQGGGGALMAGQDARLTTTAPLMPYIAQGFGGFDQASITNQRGPMLLLSGTADTIAAPATHQEPVFDTTNVPVFWANLVNGDHVAVSFGIPTYREPMLAWFRLHLMGDESFRAMFYGPDCALCSDAAWLVQRRGIN